MGREAENLVGREEGAELKLIETLGWSEGAAKKAKEKVGNTVHAVEAKAGEGKTGIDTKIEQANRGLSTPSTQEPNNQCVE